MVIVVPIYEEEQAGVYYNTAAVIDADGKYLGKYRKTHIPHCKPGFWEKFYFRPGNLGYPVFETAYAKVGVYICYDRHFPEGARALGLNGAEIVFNPSATVAGLSEYLWKLEQPAHAVANGYFVGAINRVGNEAPWNIGEFYGQSYFCDPRGKIVAEGPRDKDAVVVADLDLDLIDEVRSVWQFYRDRRPGRLRRRWCSPRTCPGAEAEASAPPAGARGAARTRSARSGCAGRRPPSAGARPAAPGPPAAGMPSVGHGLLVQGARVDDRLRLAVGAEHDQQVADHRRLALLVELHLAALGEQLQRHLDHARPRPRRSSGAPR